MYYDINKHPEFEYVFYCRVNGGKPYIIPRKFNSMDEVHAFIADLEDESVRFNRAFFVDNSFYKNKHSQNEKGIYYRVMKRPVADWENV